jgi:hypothetical protein
MRIARQLVLLCGTALTAVALGAPAAAAFDPVEFDREAFGSGCIACILSVDGESHMNVFGVRVSTCHDELDIFIEHNGTGTAEYFNSSHDSGGSCTRIQCNGVGESSAESRSSILGTEETSPGVAEMSYRFCLDAASNPNATGTHCTTPLDIAEQATNHRYAFDMHATCAGGIVEVEGEWASDFSHIEIDHL